MKIVVMGVSGSGKSTLGAGLAQALGARFVDGDDLHPAGNIAHMSSGLPLSDEMRWPWLDACAAAMMGHVVLACSCLKERYRAHLAARVAGLQFIYPQISHADVLARMSAREGHFMPTALLDSQFEALEPPKQDEAICVDGLKPIDEIVQDAVKQLTR